MKLEVTETQKRLIYSSMEQLKHDVWEDPEAYADIYADSDEEYEKLIREFIKKEIDPLLKQLK